MRIKISNVQTIELPDDVDIEDAAQLFQNPTVVQSYDEGEAEDDVDADDDEDDLDDEDDEDDEDA